jgi:hypothetical protein
MIARSRRPMASVASIDFSRSRARVVCRVQDDNLVRHRRPYHVC